MTDTAEAAAAIPTNLYAADNVIWFQNYKIAEPLFLFFWKQGYRWSVLWRRACVAFKACVWGRKCMAAMWLLFCNRRRICNVTPWESRHVFANACANSFFACKNRAWKWRRMQFESRLAFCIQRRNLQKSCNSPFSSSVIRWEYGNYSFGICSEYATVLSSSHQSRKRKPSILNFGCLWESRP